MTTSAETTSQEAKAFDLNLTVFEKVAKQNGWTSNADIAAALGISERQAQRVRTGKSRPGIAFMAGVLAADEDARFRRLFRIVDESAPIGGIEQ